MIRIELQHDKQIEDLLHSLVYDEKMTIREISEYLFLSTGTIVAWLRKADITPGGNHAN